MKNGWQNKSKDVSEFKGLFLPVAVVEQTEPLDRKN